MSIRFLRLSFHRPEKKRPGGRNKFVCFFHVKKKKTKTKKNQMLLQNVSQFNYCNIPILERLNRVNRQPSNGQKFNRQPSKKGKFYLQPSKKQLLLAVKVFQISVFQLLISNCWLSKNLFNWYLTTSFHVPKHAQFTVFPLSYF